MQWKKKGSLETLNTIEEAGVNVAGLSTDSHPQIKEYMRKEQKHKKTPYRSMACLQECPKKVEGIIQKKGLRKIKSVYSINYKSLLVEY